MAKDQEQDLLPVKTASIILKNTKNKISFLFLVDMRDLNETLNINTNNFFNDICISYFKT